MGIGGLGDRGLRRLGCGVRLELGHKYDVHASVCVCVFVLM